MLSTMCLCSRDVPKAHINTLRYDLYSLHVSKRLQGESLLTLHASSQNYFHIIFEISVCQRAIPDYNFNLYLQFVSWLSHKNHLLLL